MLFRKKRSTSREGQWTRETARQLLELYFRHGKEQDAFLQKLSVKSDKQFRTSKRR